MFRQCLLPSSAVQPTEKYLQLWVDTKDSKYLEQLIVNGKERFVAQCAETHAEIAVFLSNYKRAQSQWLEIEEAVRRGSLRRVKSHVQSEAMAVLQDLQGATPLHLAVQQEKHHIAEFLAESFPSCLAVADKYARTPLHYAAGQNSSIYDSLIKAGADATLKDSAGLSADDYRLHPEKLWAPSDVDVDISSVVSQGSSASNTRMAELADEDEGAADAPHDAQVDEWLADGDTESLERLVLDGHGHLLVNKKTEQTVAADFLLALPQYQQKIEAIHKAVGEGDVRRVKSLIDRPQLSVARDAKGMTPLHKAVLHDQTDTIRYLLGKFPQSVNALDHGGRTALHYAAGDSNGGHYVKLLQKAGADAFIEDRFGHTPFYYRTNPEQLNLKVIKQRVDMDLLTAGEQPRPLLQELEDDISDWLESGNVDKLEELVLNGYGDLVLGRTHDVQDQQVLSFLEILPQYQAKIYAIHRAVQAGNTRDVKLLTDRKKLALCRDTNGATPLHNALIHGHLDLAKYLVRNYPLAVNAQDHNRRTPLHIAAVIKDNGYTYKLLRKCGADPNVVDCFGRTPKYYLNHAVEVDLEAMRLDTRTALRRTLHNRVAPSYMESSIEQWLRDGNVAKLEQLVLSGCGDLLLDRSSLNADATDFLDGLHEYLDKIDQLHRAVRNGNVRRLKTLIDRKRLAMARDRKGATPLHDAVLYEQTEVLRYLVQAYPHAINAPDYNRRTPLHYAAAARDGGHYLKILEKAGADPKLVDNEGHTPEYYQRNMGTIDLKLIRERDQDSVADLRELTEAPIDGADERSESRLSESSVGTPNSTVGLDLTWQTLDAAPTAAFEQNGGAEFDLTASRDVFARALESRLAQDGRLDSGGSRPATEHGLYLASTVGPVLTQALAEVVVKRPADPIGYVSDWLLRYHQQQQAHEDTSSDKSKSIIANGTADGTEESSA